MTDVIKEHIELVEGEGGPKARIAGHRIRVQDIVIWHEKVGMSPTEIVQSYPTIALADVYAALAYYWDHRDEIERAILDEHEDAEQLRSSLGGSLLERLKNR